MFDGNDDRPHEATESRRRKAEADGRVGTSQELVAAVAALAAVAVGMTLAPQAWETISETARAAWEQTDVSANADSACLALLRQGGRVAVSTVVPGLLLVAAAGCLVHGLQIGFRWFPRRLEWDWQRLSPTAGAKRLVTGESAARWLVGLAKAILLAGLAAGILWQTLPELLALGQLGEEEMVARASVHLARAGLKLCLAGAAVGLADYGIRRWLSARRLRMSEEERRDDERQQQGGRRRAGSPRP